MKKNRWIKILSGAVITGAALLTLAACGSKQAAHTYTVGVTGDADYKIWEQVAKDVKSQDGITLNIKNFSDYTQLNPALEDGSLNLNAFQSIIYQNTWNSQHKGNIKSIGYTYISPFGLYSKKITNYKDLKDGDSVAVPNDPANEGRALRLLAAIGVITLKANSGDTPGLTDIASYNKKIKITPLAADQIVAALPSVTAACINTNYVVDQLHTTPDKSAIYVDTSDKGKVSAIYKNDIAENPKKVTSTEASDYAKIVKAYQTDSIAKLVKAENNIPAW
ncbi:MAG: MetQ/NlpA family ABC transporter substrate-binding protein [Streptococcaceae bacterium]|jgi:D-methionine transport system substrate-binding protein|nr:MetQ/NlpA family ABC transporter substrate-binding protein [Streptococcaceae bacterium]